MKESLSSAEVRARAETWYEQQLANIARVHGATWPRHKVWIEEYLREDLRQRLVARGWRPRK